MYSIQTQNFLRNAKQNDDTFEFKGYQFNGIAKIEADNFTKSQHGKVYEEPILDWLNENVKK